MHNLKTIGILLFLFALNLADGRLLAQTYYENDVNSIDNIVNALYEVISGKAGEERDWSRFSNLFKEESRLIPTNKNSEGTFVLRSMSPGDYIELFKKNIKSGFFERELHHEVLTYGTIAHVFSTYETIDEPNGKITNRGINSIQIFKDEKRYYIVSIFWCAESMGFPLPEKYLN
ncbi:MAG: hypothetical protein RIB47_02925 [Cyclobacteriaceae bacterium]